MLHAYVFEVQSVSNCLGCYRAATDAPLEAKVRKGPVELEGLKIGDRYAVLFSPYDLSCALEKHDSLECEGYMRDDAERIGLNLLLYASFGF